MGQKSHSDRRDRDHHGKGSIVAKVAGKTRSVEFQLFLQSELRVLIGCNGRVEIIHLQSNGEGSETLFQGADSTYRLAYLHFVFLSLVLPYWLLFPKWPLLWILFLPCSSVSESRCVRHPC